MPIVKQDVITVDQVREVLEKVTSVAYETDDPSMITIPFGIDVKHADRVFTHLRVLGNLDFIRKDSGLVKPERRYNVCGHDKSVRRVVYTVR